MNPIIPFPIKPYVKIMSGNMTETRRVSAAGIAITRYPQPIVTYFLDYVDDDGFSCVVWDGETYADALAVAQTWAAEGVAVRDHTDECRGRA